MQSKKIGITGGIGSGKTTVSHLFAMLGVPVYDSDWQAKRLMEEDVALRDRLIARFGRDIYSDQPAAWTFCPPPCNSVNTVSTLCPRLHGRFNIRHLNRKVLAERIFHDPRELSALNALVHPVVIADFRRWAIAQTSDYLIIESALLFESGLDKEVDRVVVVTAPRTLRIERACLRDDSNRTQIERRMAAQLTDDEFQARADFIIHNTDMKYLEAEVLRLDQIFRHEF